MNKQTFQIPEGCRAITVEQIGNQLVPTFDVEPKFEDGDILIDEQIGWAIYIYRKTDESGKGYFYCLFDSSLGLSLAVGKHYGYTSTARLATPKEAQKLFDALKEYGRAWDPETKKLEEIKKDRWRGGKGEEYYSLYWDLSILTLTEAGDNADDKYYKTGNYFQTKEQAERARLYIHKAYNDFWEDELK